MSKNTRRSEASGTHRQLGLAAVALSLASCIMSMPAPAIADTGGDTSLYVERTEQGKQAAKDEQQRTTVITPPSSSSAGGSLPKTGDDSLRGVAAIAALGCGLTAAGTASRRLERKRIASTSQDAAGEHAAHRA